MPAAADPRGAPEGIAIADPSAAREASWSCASGDWLRLGNDECESSDPAPPARPEGRSGAAEGLPRFPGYELLEVLGRGGMGVVYKARQVALGRIVALKVLGRDTAVHPEELARFRAEAEVLAQLHHPHVVQVFDLGVHDGTPFITLEYVNGGNLRDELQRGPLSPMEAGHLLATLADTIHHAHVRGILHRDLKPANILLACPNSAAAMPASPRPGSTGRERLRFPKIADFGLAGRIRGSEAAPLDVGFRGTPAYVAPEQLSSQATDLGPAVDVYALGVILYESLTGRPPFPAMSPADYFLQVSLRAPIALRYWLPRIPRDLETICLKCLEKNPRDRYATAEALADDLRRFLVGRPIQARPVGILEKLWRWCRADPVTSGLAAAVCVSLASTFGLLGVGFIPLHLENRRAVAAHDAARAAASEALDRARAIAGARSRDAHRRQQARRALNVLAARTLDDVAGPPHLLAEEQRHVLRQTLELFHGLAADDGEDLGFADDVARSWLHVGVLRHLLGEWNEAATACRQAMDAWRRLLAVEPDRQDVLEALAATHARLAMVLAELDQLPAAVDECERALEITSRRNPAQLSHSRSQRDLAAMQVLAAQLYDRQGRHDAAERSYRAAVQAANAILATPGDEVKSRRLSAAARQGLASVLCSRHAYDEAEILLRTTLSDLESLPAKSPADRAQLAEAWRQLARVFAQKRQTDDARGALEAALGHRQALAMTFSGESRHAVELAKVLSALGTAHADDGRYDAARKRFEEAAQLLAPLLQLPASTPGVRAAVREALRGQAMALDQLRRHAEAYAVREEALRLSTGGEKRDLMQLQVESQLAAGRLREAIAMGGRMLAEAIDDPGLAYWLATVCARAAGQASGEREEWERQAVELLDRARRGAWFQDQKRLRSFLEEKAFDPLRSRADFVTLMKQSSDDTLPTSIPSVP